jgi:DNA-binding Lrp family transcriptional regulator
LDTVDLGLSQLLLANSRTPYQELADKLGLSVNAVHKRVQGLLETGVIRAFTAKVSLTYLRAVTVWVFGRSEAEPFEEVHLKLQNDDSTYWVSYSSANFIYVGGYLRDISELERYVSFVKREAVMREPMVGLLVMPPSDSPPEKLFPLDFKIIKALHRNARRPLSEVAVEVGASARTLQRRLDAMVSKGLVELSIEWYPDVSNDIVSLSHFHLSPTTDRRTFTQDLWRRYSPNVLFFMDFSNLPGETVAFTWSNSMRELKDLRDRLAKEEGVESLNMNVLQIGFLSDTWRDRLLLERSAGSDPRAE